MKNVKNEKYTLQDLDYGQKTEKKKSGKRETHMVGTGIWRETLKTWKMKHKHCITWNMARNTPKR